MQCITAHCWTGDQLKGTFPLCLASAPGWASSCPVTHDWSALCLLVTCDVAGWAPPIIWTTLAIYYGGAAQFIAGMISFAKNDVFSATAFSTYGSFWLARAVFCLLYAYPGGQVRRGGTTLCLP